jgi:zona occludens toxin (predicted ATPase)
MIEICSGLVGGGKSYFSVIRILESLSQGRTVVTNVSIDSRRVAWHMSSAPRHYWDRYVKGITRFSIAKQYLSRIRILSDDDVTHFWDFGFNNSFIVLDELHLYFSNRDWARVPKSLVRYLSQHRKGHDDIFLMTQNINNLDVTYRRLASRFWHVHNPKNVPMFRFLPIPLPEFFIANGYYGEISNKVIDTRIMTPSKMIFALYDTYHVHDKHDGQSAREAVLGLPDSNNQTVSNGHNRVDYGGSVPSHLHGSDIVVHEHHSESPLRY